MRLAEVVPWGRSFAEYQQMFALSEKDLQAYMLGCGDGPASFNAEFTAAGGQVVSADPLYTFSVVQIAERIEQTRQQVLEQVRQNHGQFVWKQIGSIEELDRIRRQAMGTFLADYPDGLAAGRYLPAGLPQLPFADQSFDLALCSHYLFLYSEHLDRNFHLQSLRELCRVAKEVRIFPLVDLNGEESIHLQPILYQLAADEYRLEIEGVEYEFQKGGNQQLRLSKSLA